MDKQVESLKEIAMMGLVASIMAIVIAVSFLFGKYSFNEYTLYSVIISGIFALAYIKLRIEKKSRKK